MNKLEINFSDYQGSKSGFSSKRIDDKLFFSHGHKLTMSELENNVYQDKDGYGKEIDPIDHFVETNDGKFLLVELLIEHRSLLLLKRFSLFFFFFPNFYIEFFYCDIFV